MTVMDKERLRDLALRLDAIAGRAEGAGAARVAADVRAVARELRLALMTTIEEWTDSNAEGSDGG